VKLIARVVVNFDKKYNSDNNYSKAMGGDPGLSLSAHAWFVRSTCERICIRLLSVFYPLHTEGSLSCQLRSLIYS
jgi:hypothetical protein